MAKDLRHSTTITHHWHFELRFCERPNSRTSLRSSLIAHQTNDTSIRKHLTLRPVTHNPKSTDSW